MAGIPKPGEVDSANTRRPNVQQLSVDHQNILDGVQKKIREDKEKEIQKIREEKEKEIQKLEEEAMNQYISHFSIDRQGKVTTDDAFDASQFEVKFDENEQPILNSEIANAIDDAVSSHVNNKLEFIGQNMHDMFDDALAELKYILVEICR